MCQPWTEETVRAFIAFVRQAGGEVKLPVRILRDGGIEANIVCPPNAPAGWARTALTEFERRYRRG